MPNKNNGLASQKWIPIDEFLPEKFNFDYNEDVGKIINYIEKERENLIYTGKNPENSYIFLNPAAEIASTVHTFEAAQFLIFLKRKNIITDLHLPIFVRKTANKEVIEIKLLSPVWLNAEYAVVEILRSPKEFAEKIVKFKVKNWKEFLEIKSRLEQQSIELPTDPEVIEEYLWVLNTIEKERQRTPKGEAIAYPIPEYPFFAPGVPNPEQETSILRIFEQNDLIRITQKTVSYTDPLGLDPYDNSKTIRAVEIRNIKKFETCRNKLLELQVPTQIEVSIKNQNNKQDIDEVTQRKISLKSAMIKYNENEAVLEIGNQKCQIPPYKNEHYFCRAMYEHRANEPIDWSIIYEKMTGYYEAYYGKPQNVRENWRLVYDTMEALNRRIKETVNTDDNLFAWKEKTVKRNY